MFSEKFFMNLCYLLLVIYFFFFFFCCLFQYIIINFYLKKNFSSIFLLKAKRRWGLLPVIGTEPGQSVIYNYTLQAVYPIYKV